MPEPSLRQMQDWLMQRVTAPGQAHGDPLTMVLDDPRLPAEARLAIYARGYLERLLECLRAEFPALRGLVGDQVFDLFARGYLAARPSRSYSLYDLGAGFADHLAATAPADGGDPLDRLPADLARLERARVEANRAAGPEREPGWASVNAAGLLMTPGARLRTPPTVRLLRLSFRLAEILRAADRGERPDVPEAAPTLYAVARARWRVTVHDLSPTRFALLEACQGSGEIHAALAQAARICDRPAGELWADLAAWAPLAVEAGLLA